MVSYTKQFIIEAYGAETITEVKIDGNPLVIVNINNLFAYVFCQNELRPDHYDRIAKKKVRMTRKGDGLYLRLMRRRVYLRNS